MYSKETRSDDYLLTAEDLYYSRFTTKTEFEMNFNSLVKLLFELKDKIDGKEVKPMSDIEIDNMIAGKEPEKEKKVYEEGQKRPGNPNWSKKKE